VALPNPGVGPEKFLLPAVFTLSELYESYCTHLKKCVSDVSILITDKKSDKPVSWGKVYEHWKTNYSTYCNVWGQRDGCCEKCCLKTQEIKDCKNDPNKLELLTKELEEHRNLATTARKTYNEHRINTAKEDGKVVISLDFAENLMVPHLSNIPSTFYFRTKRKIDIFGICNEEITENGSIQLNYVIDEPFKIEKGANAVISMFDHYLANYVEKGKSLVIYADNCCAQNKNQYFIGYLCYLVKILKQYNEIELYFMVVGHTKFSPDSHFGNLKTRFSKAKCQSIVDLLGEEGIIHKSATNNKALPYKDPLTLKKNFEWKDWKGFLPSKFNNCTNIGKWHVVKIQSFGLNISVAKSLGEPFEEYKIMKGELMIDENEQPSILEPKGLGEPRKEELEYFEQFVDSEHKLFIKDTY